MHSGDVRERALREPAQALRELGLRVRDLVRRGEQQVRPADPAQVQRLGGTAGFTADAGLSQEALAERAGLARPKVARLKAGRHLPSLATLRRVVDPLGNAEDRERAEAGLPGTRGLVRGDGGLVADSVALGLHPGSLDRSRLGRRLGTVGRATVELVVTGVLEALGVDVRPAPPGRRSCSRIGSRVSAKIAPTSSSSRTSFWKTRPSRARGGTASARSARVGRGPSSTTPGARTLPDDHRNDEGELLRVLVLRAPGVPGAFRGRAGSRWELRSCA